GAHSAVLFDHGPKYETGDAQQANTTSWPCGQTNRAPNCTTGTGLFCYTDDCSTLEGRTRVNDRLLRAVLAAQLTTWTQHLPQMPLKLPYYIHLNRPPMNASRNVFIAGNGFPLTAETNT